IGPPNRGLNCMFTFMNTARAGTAVQGVAAAEASYQGALPHAQERLAMRPLSGHRCPAKEADPIIVPPDLRRRPLAPKAVTEGGPRLIHYLGQLADVVEQGTDEAARKYPDDMLAFLTPIAQAFCTETGFEAANPGVQVFGGHGYIREWGMEQSVRDTRISML